VEERHKNQVQRVSLDSGETQTFATGLNSPIGLAVVGGGEGRGGDVVVVEVEEEEETDEQLDDAVGGTPV
jgi:hypothetical protein